MAQTAGRPAPWALAILGLLLASCATLGLGGSDKTKLAVSPKDPSAEGIVTTSAARNGNVSVDVTAKHLANPERLDPPASTYVVWIKPQGSQGRAQNMGALKVDRNLRGTLDTVVPWKSFELFITPERQSDAQQPYGERLMWATVGG